jgi:hypothetical protein
MGVDPVYMERAPMDFTLTELFKSADMLARRVPFVPIEPISRKLHVETFHEFIASHLRHNRCGCDRETLLVSMNNRLRRYLSPSEVISIDQKILGPWVKFVDSFSHSKKRCLADVYPVHDFMSNDPDAYAHGMFFDFKHHLLALASSKLLGISHSVNCDPSREDHCARNNWSGKRTSTGLVDAGDVLDPPLPEARLPP